MKILIATPELAPFSGATPLATAALRVARHLQFCPDTEVAIALPASTALLRSHSKSLTERGLLSPESARAADGAPTRILQLDRETGPDTFVIDTPSLREAFDPGRDDSLLVENAFHWASLVVALLGRIEPAIDLVHGFGWESSLVPILVSARRLPVATALSSTTARATGPSLRAAVSAAPAWGLDLELAEPRGRSLDQPLYSWAATRADATDALTGLGDAETTHEKVGANTSTTGRERVLGALGFEGGAGLPLLYVPGRFPAALLPILPRLLDTGARVILGSDPGDPSDAATLIALSRSRPGRIATPATALPTGIEAADILAVADFVLLHPDSDAPPEIPRRALGLGCSPILSNRHPALADAAFRAADDDRPAIVFRDDSPEAIWAILKHAVALHADPARWKEHLARIHHADETPGGLSPELAGLYRRAVARKLVFD